MNNSKLFLQAVLFSFGVFVYVALVSWLLFNGESFFGKMNNFQGPLLMLLLLVFSVVVMGLLVLGKPAYLYFSGFKKEGIQLFFYTLILLFIIILAVIISQILY
ncbi:MAG: hypothetical protein ABIJ28_02190 [Patescibacteria group bacterium]